MTAEKNEANKVRETAEGAFTTDEVTAAALPESLA